VRGAAPCARAAAAVGRRRRATALATSLFPTPRASQSAVLRAIGVSEDLAHTSIRFGLGRFTTEQEVDYAIHLCEKHVKRLREMSPLWEMVQEGIDLKTIQWTQAH